MTRNLSIRDRAVQDIAEQFAWYAERSVDVARRFRVAVMETLHALQEMPELGAVFDSQQWPGIRIRRVPGFKSILILYQALAESIDVIRVFHASQDWQSMLDE